MELSYKVKNGAAVVRLEWSNLDVAKAVEFKEKVFDVIVEANLGKMVLDLSELEFVDSSGVGSFLVVKRWVEEREGRLKLACLGPQVKRVIEAAQLDRSFEIYETVEAALAAFSQ